MVVSTPLGLIEGSAMYGSILTAVDGSLNAHAAARYAIALAQACGATLYVAGVITPEMTGQDEGSLAQSAGALVAESEGTRVPAHLLIERGDVVKTLEGLARTHRIDMVMTASRREDAEHRYFMRTVPQRLMRVLTASLIVVRVVHLGVLAHPRAILVPVLGGPRDHAERTYLVARLARHFRASVIVFHALEAIPRSGGPGAREAGARRVEAVAEELLQAGVEVHFRVVTGPLVGESIMQEAARHRHDLIVMGASQRSLLTKWRRGNPVEDVMRRTPCDLFVCRSHGG
jgi:nucleotide-binding universal stress UspA family protein